MPFTLAHPALILPMAKSKRFSLTALIAGSIVPDFEFFFQMKEVENIGHHWYGIILFDVPMAWLFCYLFHGLLKNILVANLPAYYKNRFTPLLRFNWIQYADAHKAKVFFSILCGVATHILWDGFTHADGMFVEIVPPLSTMVHIGSKQFPVFYLLQVIFSLAGMLFLFRTITQLPVAESHAGFPLKNRFFWPLLLMLFAVIFSIRINYWPQHNSFWGIVMAGMGGLTYAWILGSILIQQFQILKNKS
ncbi:MAG TPA: DUF4184 family protein [Chitinophagaceae bacterium]|nr:DUF4184 family protein [Chitinophagaceae bacterium]